MPATNGLQPPLTIEERAIVKSYGDWTSFMHSYGLKPQNLDESNQALRILRGLVENDLDEEDEEDSEDDERLIPGLSREARQVVRSFGDWNSFMAMHGLRPWEPEDISDALDLVEDLAERATLEPSRQTAPSANLGQTTGQTPSSSGGGKKRRHRAGRKRRGKKNTSGQMPSQAEGESGQA
ncbi:hypothetical protein KEM55_005182, partial [Ascosphaera atra]